MNARRDRMHSTSYLRVSIQFSEMAEESVLGLLMFFTFRLQRPLKHECGHVALDACFSWNWWGKLVKLNEILNGWLGRLTIGRSWETRMSNQHDKESELGHEPSQIRGRPEHPVPMEDRSLQPEAYPDLLAKPDEALRQSEARFRKFYDNAPVMMHSIDKDRIIRNVNSKWLTEMGYQREEVIGRKVTAFMTPESGRVMASILPVFWRDRRVSAVNFQYVKKDGTVIDVVLDSVVIEDPVWGEASLSIVRDVTEHKYGEEALRRSEEKYRLLFDHAPIGIVSVDKQGRIVEVNRTLVDILGSPSVDATRAINILTFPLLVESGLSSTFQLCMEEGRIVTIELPYTSKWGKECYLRFIMTPMTDSQGQVSGCQAVVEDVTERKRTEDSLRESEERYRLLTQHSLSGIYIHQKGILVYVNDRLAKILGYAPHEVRTRHFWDFVHPEDRGSLKGAGIQVTLGADAISQYEFRVICKDGQIKWLQVLSTEIMYRGQPASMGNVADISERKQTEADLDKAQALLLAAIEQTPAGILIADAPDVRVRLANPAALGIIGKSSQPLKDIPFESHPRHWQTFHPDGTPFEVDELPLNRAILRGETSKNVEAVIRQPQGEDRWVLANAAPVRNAAGEIVAGVVVFPDITERKRAERALSESQEKFRRLYEESKRREELYRSLLDSSPDAVVIYDLEGRAQYVNDAFTRIFGWTSEEVSPPDEYRSFRIPSRTLRWQAIRSVIQDGEPLRGSRNEALYQRRTLPRHQCQRIPISRSRGKSCGNAGGPLGYHRPKASRRTAPTGRQNGSHRAPCRRSGPRLQQHPDRDDGILQPSAPRNSSRTCAS